MIVFDSLECSARAEVPNLPDHQEIQGQKRERYLPELFYQDYHS